jgi:arylsulfatase A-like enzyme
LDIKKNMRKFSSISLLVLAISLGWSCGQKRPLDRSRDIIQEVKAQLREETREILFQRDDLPREKLLRGWSFPEERLLWADSRRSSLAFCDFNEQNDVRVVFEARPALTAGGRQQKAAFGINRRKVDSFVLESGRYGQYNADVPGQLLHLGPNLLQFSFSYASRPADVDPGRKDSRTLAAAFTHMEFQREVLDAGDKGLRQNPGAVFSYIAPIEKKCRLSVAYTNQRDTESRIRLENEVGEEIKLFKLSPEETAFDKTFKVPKSGLYKFYFITEGRADSFALWNQIKLYLTDARNRHPDQSEELAAEGAPVIILYVVDTVRADQVSCYGYERETTPRLDQFAEDNALFLKAYANAAWTRPSAASIWSGLFPKNHQTQSKDDKLSEDAETLAEIFQENGYFTAAFIGNGNLHSHFGFNQGFDEYNELHGTYAYSQHVQSSHINQAVFPFLEEYTSRKQRQPLFLVIWTVDPHDPYTPEKDVMDLFNIDTYDPIDTFNFGLLNEIRAGRIKPTPSQIEFMRTRYDQEIYFNDRSFGALLDKLKELNLFSNAAVVFTSDHGEEFFEHGSVGHGHSLYREQLHVPLVIKSASIRPGKHEERVQLTDLFPTLLETAGIPVPDHIDGTSILRLPLSARTLFFEEKKPWLDLTAMMDEDKKCIYNKMPSRAPSRAYVPLLEFFPLTDKREQTAYPPAGIRDAFRIQQMLTYRHTLAETSLDKRQVDIPENIDEMLKALGYIK